METQMRNESSLRLALCTILTVSPALAAGGSSIEPPKADSSTKQAAQSYNEGLKHRDEAWRLEDDADSAATDEQRARLEADVRKAYEAAIAALKRAVELNPALYQAHSSLGYSLRRIGEWDAALSAYDQALRIEPHYAEALEYRAEAYLGLNRLDEAREAFRVLAGQDAKRAGELVAAMRSWIAARRSAPHGLEPKAIDDFERWVEQDAGPKVASAPAAATRKSRDW